MNSIENKKNLFLEFKNLSDETKKGIEFLMAYFDENTVKKAVESFIQLAPIIIKKADENLQAKKGTQVTTKSSEDK